MFRRTAFVAALVSLVAASSVKRQSTVPAVTYPHAGTTWFPTQTHNITWTTPASGTVDIFLGAGETLGSGNPFLSNVDLTPGHVEITVPNVPAGNNYKVVLSSGSSFGTPSPQFGIGVAAGAPGSPSSVSVTESSSTTSSATGSSNSSSTASGGETSSGTVVIITSTSGSVVTTFTSTEPITTATITSSGSVTTETSSTESVVSSTSVSTSTASSTTVTSSTVVSSTTSVPTTHTSTSPGTTTTSTGAPATTSTGAAVPIRVGQQAIMAAIPAAAAILLF